MDSGARQGDGEALPAPAPQRPSGVDAPRHAAERARLATARITREALRVRTPLTLTVLATGDRPNLSMCLTGPSRLCRQVRGIGLVSAGSSRLRRVPALTRHGDGFVWLAVDLPHDVFAEPASRLIEVFGWQGLMSVRLTDPEVVTHAENVTTPLAARWKIRLDLGERGRLRVHAHQPEDLVTAHELLLAGDQLQLAWEHAAMVRELRLCHDPSGVVLTVPSVIDGLRAVAGAHLDDLCAPGPGTWTVEIGEPGGPWLALVQDRALQESWMAARPVRSPVLARGAGRARIRSCYDSGGALSLRVEACEPSLARPA